MNKSKIEWCDSTWNPVTGCLHGCDYCYARKIADRFGTLYKGNILPEDEGLTFIPNTPETFYELDEPVRDNNGKIEPYPANFYPTLHRYKMDEYIKKKGRTIFVCSMADLFGYWVPDEWIDEVFAACEKAPQHRYIFLTKAPNRLFELANKGKLPAGDNYWYGTSITQGGQRAFLDGVRYNTFLSIEPLLGPLNTGLGSFGSDKWVIIGAETGNRKGKAVPKQEWIDRICETADITRMAVFMKDSLIPIVGEENMRREFPWSTKPAGMAIKNDDFQM